LLFRSANLSLGDLEDREGDNDDGEGDLDDGKDDVDVDEDGGDADAGSSRHLPFLVLFTIHGRKFVTLV